MVTPIPPAPAPAPPPLIEKAAAPGDGGPGAKANEAVVDTPGNIVAAGVVFDVGGTEEVVEAEAGAEAEGA